MFAFLASKLMIKKGFSHIGIFFLYVLSLLPLSVLHLFARLLYYPLYYIIGYRKKVVRENLEKSFPTKDSKEIILIEKTFYKYFVDLVFEIIKMSTISKKELLRRVKFKNFRHGHLSRTAELVMDICVNLLFADVFRSDDCE